MNSSAEQAQSGTGDLKAKWFNSPVLFQSGTLPGIRASVPEFERRAFDIIQRSGEQNTANVRLDTIVRLPCENDRSIVPVGVVSKDYALVQHTAVLDVASTALEESEIDPSEVRADLTLTEYGERMALSLYLPERYSFDPGDGHLLAMRLECFNSVDASTRFRALMGWFRFVCSNGLVIGVTRVDLRRRHVGDLRVDDIGVVLRSGLKDCAAEKACLTAWRQSPVLIGQIRPWVEDSVRKQWGIKAATRAYHIARTGQDAVITGPYKGATPTNIAVELGRPVPGSENGCRNLYDVSQVLAWLAQERRDVSEQLEWRAAIPELMRPLTG